VFRNTTEGVRVRLRAGSGHKPAARGVPQVCRFLGARLSRRHAYQCTQTCLLSAMVCVAQKALHFCTFCPPTWDPRVGLRTPGLSVTPHRHMHQDAPSQNGVREPAHVRANTFVRCESAVPVDGRAVGLAAHVRWLFDACCNARAARAREKMSAQNAKSSAFEQT
jgi:hypothetical protein